LQGGFFVSEQEITRRFNRSQEDPPFTCPHRYPTDLYGKFEAFNLSMA